MNSIDSGDLLNCRHDALGLAALVGSNVKLEEDGRWKLGGAYENGVINVMPVHDHGARSIND